MLEPMNPYERRIIHSEVQTIKGVSTNSIGSENNRKIVIYLDNSAE
jgi:spoIIIJ-associated protein